MDTKDTNFADDEIDNNTSNRVRWERRRRKKRAAGAAAELRDEAKGGSPRENSGLYYAVDWKGFPPDRVDLPNASRRAREATQDINEAKSQWDRGPRDRPAGPGETAKRQAIAVARGRQRRGRRPDGTDDEGDPPCMKDQSMDMFEYVKENSVHHTRLRAKASAKAKPKSSSSKGLGN